MVPNNNKPFFSRLHTAVIVIISFVLFWTLAATAQSPKYRTFSQEDLALKKANAGKITGSHVCFKFYNTTDSIVNDLHVKFNSTITVIEDAGGFPVTEITERGKVLNLSGKDVTPGDSVTICLTVTKKDSESAATSWWWTKDGKQLGAKNKSLKALSYDAIRIQPNGGNVLQYLYKRVIRRPEGVVVGIPTDTPGSGWIRYMKADRKYFPHSDSARCFDYIATGSSRIREFAGELKNPHVKKHNNHLLGELHALKLAIIANDSGVTEPIEISATLFSDLVYNDTANPGDICNGKTIRQIASLADSGMTYCSHFDDVFYKELDECIGRINDAFDGSYTAFSFDPFILAGTQELSNVYFLHPNPIAAPVARPVNQYSLIDEAPEQFELRQNYPNPFNPSTTIEFTIPEPALVTLTVYNLLGQEVAKVLSNAELDEGEQSVEFNAENLSSGVYFYHIAVQGTGEFKKHTQVIKRMVLIK